MLHAYKSSRPNDEYLELCFEILGFDIMIDNDLKPWLLEVFLIKYILINLDKSHSQLSNRF
jgi:hypothetical protein